MADLAALTGVYNHYLTTYAPKSNSALDTHKKSELRGIYNSIVKINKESPLYILDDSADSKAYAIGLKEGARELQHTLASLGGLNEEELLNKKIAYSSNESIASVKYIGDSTSSNLAPELSIEVKSLASPQINLGKYLPSNAQIELEPDTYSFDLGINDFNYEFQFQIRPDDTNRDVQERLQRLINNADIGVYTEIAEDEEGNSSLKLTSQKSGMPENKEAVFHVSDNQTSKTSGVVDLLGIGTMTRMPSNAEFVLNGVERTSTANAFTVEKMYEINLNGISPTEGETATIGIKPDTESLIENMHSQEIQHFCDDTDYNNSKSFWHIAEYITEIEFCGGVHLN